MIFLDLDALAPSDHANARVQFGDALRGLVGGYAPDAPSALIHIPSAQATPAGFEKAARDAGIEPGDGFYLGRDPARLRAAHEAGFRVAALVEPRPAPEPDPIAEVYEEGEAFPRPGFAAALASSTSGEVRRYALRGRVVTLDDDARVLDDGHVFVENGVIVAVRPASADTPAAFADAPVVATDGTIYPGLIDLHNHFVYNLLPLWVVPNRYDNRTQWPRHAEYRSDVTLPIRLLGSYELTSRALIRYVEAKSLVGGTTTGQGIWYRGVGGNRLNRGAMRNVEFPRRDDLPRARTRVPDARPDTMDAFRRALDSELVNFYHLSEGIDDAARERFLDLQDVDLLRPNLVGIHSLGLHPDDLAAFAEAGGSVIWSPFSNLLLYGQTLDLGALLASGIKYSIGCDWSPSGSKNLLEELKVARWVSRHQGAGISSKDLVRGVTRSAAEILRWDEKVGAIREGALADLLVIRGDTGDPYDLLIDATEADIRLVVIEGTPRFGEADLVEEVFGRDDDLEAYGDGRALYLRAPDSPIDDLSFADAEATLREAMADLPAYQEAMERETADTQSMGLSAPSGFQIILDNEWDGLEGPHAGADFLAPDWSQLAESVELDAPEVARGSHLDRVADEDNIPDGLKEALTTAYPRPS